MEVKLVEHAAVGVPLLAEFAGQLHVKPVLAAAAAGTARLAVALPQELFVAGAGEADWVLVGTGDDLHLVPRSEVRLVEQPSRVLEIMLKPPPQHPHFDKPENKYFGRW